LLLFVLSSVPGRALPALPAENFDKVVHAAVYAVLGGLCLLAVRATWRLRAALAAVLAVGLATIYGISDELHQLLTPGRSADVHDVMADLVGAVIGVAALSLVIAARARKRIDRPQA
jgi:VanZ family protein